MLGIISKDWYQNFYIPNKRLAFIIYYLIWALNFLLIKNIYGFVFANLIWIPFVVTPILIQVTSERDDKTNYFKILITMPVTRKDIISARYLLGIIFILFNFALSILGMVVHVYMFKSVSLTLGIYITLASLIFSLVSLAVNYLACIVLGSRGIILSAVIITTVLISYYSQFKYFNVDTVIESIIIMKASTVFVFGFIVSALSVLFSYLLSVLYFSQKEIN